MHKQKIPDVSIVIPVFNEELYIGKLLDQIRSQKYPQNKVEAIVVDNNSTDKTRAVVKNFINNNPDMKIKLLLEKRRGVNFARNRGGAYSVRRNFNFF